MTKFCKQRFDNFFLADREGGDEALAELPSPARGGRNE
jgi:hypothetical protein